MNLYAGTCGDYAARRWARVVTVVAAAGSDLQRQAHWARATGASIGRLRMICRLAGEYPKESLDLGRLLGAIRRGRGDADWDLVNLLEICHDETLERLVRVGGVGRAVAARHAPSFHDFLVAQSFVTTPRNLDALWREMEAKGLTAPARGLASLAGSDLEGTGLLRARPSQE